MTGFQVGTQGCQGIRQPGHRLGGMAEDVGSCPDGDDLAVEDELRTHVGKLMVTQRHPGTEDDAC